MLNYWYCCTVLVSVLTVLILLAHAHVCVCELYKWRQNEIALGYNTEKEHEVQWSGRWSDVQWSTHATRVLSHNSLTAQTCSHALLHVRCSPTAVITVAHTLKWGQVLLQWGFTTTQYPTVYTGEGAVLYCTALYMYTYTFQAPNPPLEMVHGHFTLDGQSKWHP